MYESRSRFREVNIKVTCQLQFTQVQKFRGRDDLNLHVTHNLVNLQFLVMYVILLNLFFESSTDPARPQVGLKGPWQHHTDSGYM